MTFRQNAIAHRQSLIAVSIVVCLCFGITPFLDLIFVVFFVVNCIMLILVIILSQHNYITINETGIFCHTSKKQLWGYTWENIAELRKGIYLRSRGIYVLIYNKSGEPEQYAVSDHCFQLGKEAKQAIEKYYKPISELPKR